MNFENAPKLGIGIYTASEIAQILRVPYQKVYTWMNKYWDGKLGKIYGSKYSWQMHGTRAVSFHTFVEFYIMMLLSEAGVKPKEVLNAHKELMEMFKTPFPFAKKKVLESLRSDGKKIFFETNSDTILQLDGTKQFNLSIVKKFFVNLDFDNNDLATRFWPIGKDKSILVDPKRRFGHPVIDGKNIFPEIIHKHHSAGDPVNYIAHVYGLTEDEVNHAIEFCTAA
ncbi:DUF433 domain-containing protein [Galbibacter sp. EGI 63066]|uniref:DUF433 domain-containing protein n=1 Tax=Galbibacter sp. EGI 63066 TaxID=2993559 RepID=UPI002248E711|nr:DUF433 domain-containing protein [Galbibacter sp. EGI 63066]MCX2681462.1 DUF433 domain-containing protein [Galbibacter sp. EGI 63066]